MIVTLEKVKQLFSKETLEEGFRLYANQKVSCLKITANRFSGIVSDSGSNLASFQMDKDATVKTMQCSCGVTYCKHCAALIYAKENYDQNDHHENEIKLINRKLAMCTSVSQAEDLLEQMAKSIESLPIKEKIECIDSVFTSYSKAYIKNEEMVQLFFEYVDKHPLDHNIPTKALDKLFRNSYYGRYQMIDAFMLIGECLKRDDYKNEGIKLFALINESIDDISFDYMISNYDVFFTNLSEEQIIKAMRSINIDQNQYCEFLPQCILDRKYNIVNYAVHKYYGGLNTNNFIKYLQNLIINCEDENKKKLYRYGYALFFGNDQQALIELITEYKNINDYTLESLFAEACKRNSMANLWNYLSGKKELSVPLIKKFNIAEYYLVYDQIKEKNIKNSFSILEDNIIPKIQNIDLNSCQVLMLLLCKMDLQEALLLAKRNDVKSLSFANRRVRELFVKFLVSNNREDILGGHEYLGGEYVSK